MEHNNEEYDWFDELSEEQQQSVLTGIEQLDRGEFITHEEAVIKFGLQSTAPLSAVSPQPATEPKSS